MPARLYKVFLASPSDVQGERQVFVETLTQFNLAHAAQSGPFFLPVCWEHLLHPGMYNAQSKLDEVIGQCDFFVMVLHERWGSSPGDSRFTSGTEEEFALAHAKYGKGIRDIAICFKRMSTGVARNPHQEARRIIEFRKRIESGGNCTHKTFGKPNEFKDELRELAQSWYESLRDANAPLGGISKPDLEEALANGKQAFEEDRLPEAEGLLNAGLSLSTNDIAYYARFAEQLGHVSRARDDLPSAIEHFGDAFNAYQKLGNSEAALRVFQLKAALENECRESLAAAE